MRHQTRLLLASLVGALLLLLAHGELVLLLLPPGFLQDWLYRLFIVQSPVLGWGLR